MQPGALHLNGLWSRLMDRTGGGWFLITLYTKTENMMSKGVHGRMLVITVLGNKALGVYSRGSLLNLLGLWKPCFLTAVKMKERYLCILKISSYAMHYLVQSAIHFHNPTELMTVLLIYFINTYVSQAEEAAQPLQTERFRIGRLVSAPRLHWILWLS